MRLLTAKAEGLKVGNGLSPGTDMGPLNSAEQLGRINSVVHETTEREEGTIRTGGCPLNRIRHMKRVSSIHRP